MYNFSDVAVHFKRRYCSLSAAKGVQLERYIHSLKFVTKRVIFAGKSRANMENQRSKTTLIFQKEKARKARRIKL